MGLVLTSLSLRLHLDHGLINPDITAIELLKTNPSKDGCSTHLVEDGEKPVLSPALEASLRGTQGALDRLHRLGRAIRQASAGQLMSRTRRLANDDRVGSFERMAYSVLNSFYPNANPQLLERINASLSTTYQELIYRKGRLKDYRGVSWQSDEKEETVQNVHPQPEEETPANTISSLAKEVSTKPKPIYTDSKIAPSGIQSSTFSEGEFKKNYQPTSETASNTTSLHLGFASCPPPPTIQKGADYASCDWCLENHPVVMFKTQKDWRYC